MNMHIGIKDQTQVIATLCYLLLKFSAQATTMYNDQINSTASFFFSFQGQFQETLARIS